MANKNYVSPQLNVREVEMQDVVTSSVGTAWKTAWTNGWGDSWENELGGMEE